MFCSDCLFGNFDCLSKVFIALFAAIDPKNLFLAILQPHGQKLSNSISNFDKVSTFLQLQDCSIFPFLQDDTFLQRYFSTVDYTLFLLHFHRQEISIFAILQLSYSILPNQCSKAI